MLKAPTTIPFDAFRKEKAEEAITMSQLENITTYYY